MDVNSDQASPETMVQTLEDIKGGGGSIKVGTTGTIHALMSRELHSINNPSPKPAMEPNDTATDTKPDEASTSCSNTTIEKPTGGSQKTKHHHARKGSRNPILRSDSVSGEGSGTPDRKKPERKGSCMVDIVDIKCGVPDKTWTNPITNRFKKLSFSKLSETNGVK